ncbi:hypothetical protein IAT40_006401 [Kwoniella sp. CBS 6097]
MLGLTPQPLFDDWGIALLSILPSFRLAQTSAIMLDLLLLFFSLLVILICVSVYLVLSPQRVVDHHPHRTSNLLGLGISILDADCDPLFDIKRRYRGRLVLQSVFGLSLNERRTRLLRLQRRRDQLLVISAPIQILIKDLAGRTRCHIAQPSELAIDLLARIGYGSTTLKSSMYAIAAGHLLDLSQPIRQLPRDTWHLRLRVRGGGDYDHDQRWADWYDAHMEDSQEPADSVQSSPMRSLSPSDPAAGGTFETPIYLSDEDDQPTNLLDAAGDLSAYPLQSHSNQSSFPHILVPASSPERDFDLPEENMAGPSKHILVPDSDDEQTYEKDLEFDDGMQLDEEDADEGYIPVDFMPVEPVVDPLPTEPKELVAFLKQLLENHRHVTMVAKSAFTLDVNAVPPSIVHVLGPLREDKKFSRTVFKLKYERLRQEVEILFPDELKERLALVDRGLLRLPANNPQRIDLGNRRKHLVVAATLKILDKVVAPIPYNIKEYTGVPTVVKWMEDQKKLNARFIDPAFESQFDALEDQLLGAEKKSGTSGGNKTWRKLDLDLRRWLASEERKHDQLLADRAAREGRDALPRSPEKPESVVKIPIVPSKRASGKHEYIARIRERLVTVCYHNGLGMSRSRKEVETEVDSFIKRVIANLDEYQCAMLEAAPSVQITPEFLKLAGFEKVATSEQAFVYLKWVPGSSTSIDALKTSKNASSRIVGERLDRFFREPVPEHVAERFSRYEQTRNLDLTKRRETPYILHTGRTVRGKARRHTTEYSEVLRMSHKESVRPWTTALRSTPKKAGDIHYQLLSTSDGLCRGEWTKRMVWDEAIFCALFHCPSSTNVAQCGGGMPPPPAQPGGMHNSLRHLDRISGILADELNKSDRGKEERILNEVKSNFGWVVDGATARSLMRSGYSLTIDHLKKSKKVDPITWLKAYKPEGHQIRKIFCFGLEQPFPLPYRVDNLTGGDALKLDYKLYVIRYDEYNSRILQMRPGGITRYRPELPSPFLAKLETSWSLSNDIWKGMAEDAKKEKEAARGKKVKKAGNATGIDTGKCKSWVDAQFEVHSGGGVDEDDLPDLQLAIFYRGEKHIVMQGSEPKIIRLQLEAKQLLLGHPVRDQDATSLQWWEDLFVAEEQGKLKVASSMEVDVTRNRLLESKRAFHMEPSTTSLPPAPALVQQEYDELDVTVANHFRWLVGELEDEADYGTEAHLLGTEGTYGEPQAQALLRLRAFANKYQGRYDLASLNNWPYSSEYRPATARFYLAPYA